MEQTIDHLTQTSYFINCKYDDKKLATATGFFIKRNDKYYLITNWHNVTGRNPLNGKCLSKTGGIPNNLEIRVFKNQKYIDWEILTIKVLDGNQNKLWLEHPVYGKMVDVVAIEIDIPEDLAITTIEDAIEPANENTPINIGNDIFILGFPFGLNSGGFPIWKRASIASEPNIPIDNLPKMFVDTASRSGMSGSPVVYKERRPVTIYHSEKGVISRYWMKFIGIYSGRIGAEDELKAQLGIVWGAEVIDEIIKQVS